MKEIWKLLELLNEYDKEKWLHTFWKITQSNKIQIYGKWVCSESYLYSKSYGFIQWLVENDKIDFDKCWLDVRHYLSYNERYDKWIVMAENYDNDTLVREFYSPYKQLLMLLAIQDEPIRFLCEIIK